MASLIGSGPTPLKKLHAKAFEKILSDVQHQKCSLRRHVGKKLDESQKRWIFSKGGAAFPSTGHSAVAAARIQISFFPWERIWRFPVVWVRERAAIFLRF